MPHKDVSCERSCIPSLSSNQCSQQISALATTCCERYIQIMDSKTMNRLCRAAATMVNTHRNVTILRLGSLQSTPLLLLKSRKAIKTSPLSHVGNIERTTVDKTSQTPPPCEDEAVQTDNALEGHAHCPTIQCQ